MLDATLVDERISKISADPKSLPNRGMMCPKGALLSRVFDDAERLTQPMLRRKRQAELEPVSWETAIEFVAESIQHTLDTRGPNALGWYGSGQLDSEASYVFSKLFKGFLGSNHTDTNSRLCMSSAVQGYSMAFGSDGPPTCYEDLDEADVFLILGANMAVNHPVLFNRVRRRQTDAPVTTIITVDPRRSKTAAHSDLHIPVAPGADVALLQWLARTLLDRGLTDEAYIDAYTEGWGSHRDYLLAQDPEALAQQTGVNDADLQRLAEAIQPGRRLLTLYCMGANQSSRGTDKNTAILNLHLMLGQIGKPGCGPFSLTGQPNAMGGREVGYLGHQLPGYRRVDQAEDRDVIEKAWGLEAGAIHPEPGLAAVDMFNRAADGAFDVLWIACTNPVVSMPNAARVEQALTATNLVIAQDITGRSETTAFADVVLPAQQWGEKAGTMTNSERLVVRSRRFLDPPPQTRPDWWIPAQVARALGFHGFEYRSADEIWDEFRLLTAGQPCDMSGMTNDRLRAEPLHWPCPSITEPGSLRRYTNGVFHTRSGKAKFHTGSLAGPVEQPDAQYPLWLTTGRVAAHWHTRTKSALSPELARQEPDPFVELHPQDMERYGLKSGQWCRISSRRGNARAKARADVSLRPGVAFATFHFGASYANDVNLNRVTSPAYDAHSKQPELKACAVSIKPIASQPIAQEASAT